MIWVQWQFGFPPKTFVAQAFLSTSENCIPQLFETNKKCFVGSKAPVSQHFHALATEIGTEKFLKNAVAVMVFVFAQFVTLTIYSVTQGCKVEGPVPSHCPKCKFSQFCHTSEIWCLLSHDFDSPELCESRQKWSHSLAKFCKPGGHQPALVTSLLRTFIQMTVKECRCPPTVVIANKNRV